MQDDIRPPNGVSASLQLRLTSSTYNMPIDPALKGMDRQDMDFRRAIPPDWGMEKTATKSTVARQTPYFQTKYWVLTAICNRRTSFAPLKRRQKFLWTHFKCWKRPLEPESTLTAFLKNHCDILFHSFTCHLPVGSEKVEGSVSAQRSGLLIQSDRQSQRDRQTWVTLTARDQAAFHSTASVLASMWTS